MIRPDERAEGAGPFTTRLTWRLAEGGSAVWESRLARKRGVLRIHTETGVLGTPRIADDTALHRLRTLNTVAAVAFTIGGALFALGAAVAEVGSSGVTAIASIYFAGGLFFNTGGYTSLLQAINAPRRSGGTDSLVTGGWRWWSYEPARIDWLSAFVLFAGTLVFGVNLLDSFLKGLSVQQVNRLIWAPDLVGCAMFLASGHLALVEVCHGHPCWRSRSLGWWIVVVNQLGSVLFLVSALAAFTRPETGSLINTDIANWGTFAGAACFSVGGVLQLFERP
ncbi:MULTISPECIES: hypothetical protein [unclassified Kitasatospora]|uniref:hypothetical protein n=1 Tax=unclassified Kitasatospora TaxID=2633591 RepID=UPI00070C11B7|nr:MULTISPECIES: hypothetical protein [unclassified Kitasatospora]KQV11378.1 NADH-ubiquinone oxidoreductase [Kitasatospora sp. Root107]KRB62016.1 NADH-ubiquinone oxidoreductase [Kitasatospora sp. Root187]